MTSRFLAGLGLFLLVPVTVTVEANKPIGGAATCSIETGQDGASNEDGDYIFCQVVFAPGGVYVKPVAGIHVAVCHSVEPDTPLACGNSAGSVASAGGAIYSVDTVTDGNHQLTAWVKQSMGLCGVAGIGCGFDILLCNDVDLDGTCTNIGDASDQLHGAQSNEAIVGGGFILPALGDLPCVPTVTCPGTSLPTVGGDCTDTDKDVKNCGTDDDAGASFCGKPADEAIEIDDWSDGQVVTFIGWWADSWVGWLEIPGSPTNIGAGWSIGTFDAWLTVGASCTLPECDNDIDDDGNSIVDYPDDPGCDSWKDDDEWTFTARPSNPRRRESLGVFTPPLPFCEVVIGPPTELCGASPTCESDEVDCHTDIGESPCLYLLQADFCMLTLGTSGRTEEYEAAAGTTSADGQTSWSIDLPVTVSQTYDAGTYTQAWKIFYRGDSECVKISGDNWQAHGNYRTVYYDWLWVGKDSYAHGVHPTDPIAITPPEFATVVVASASNQIACDAQFELARSLVLESVKRQAEHRFGRWTILDGSAEAWWDVASVSFCSITVATSSVRLTAAAGSVTHTMSGGQKPGIGTLDPVSGTFTIKGRTEEGQEGGLVLDFTGSGQLVTCIP